MGCGGSKPESWKVREVVAFLDTIELGMHAEAFKASSVNGEICCSRSTIMTCSRRSTSWTRYTAGSCSRKSPGCARPRCASHQYDHKATGLSLAYGVEVGLRVALVRAARPMLPCGHHDA